MNAHTSFGQMACRGGGRAQAHDSPAFADPKGVSRALAKSSYSKRGANLKPARSHDSLRNVVIDSGAHTRESKLEQRSRARREDTPAGCRRAV